MNPIALGRKYKELQARRAGLRPLFVVYDDFSERLAESVAALGHRIAVIPLRDEDRDACGRLATTMPASIDVARGTFDPLRFATELCRYALVVMAGRGIHAKLYRELNRFAISNRVPFVVGFVAENLSYVLGPFVVPGEGACFECYEKRVLSNSEHPELVEDLKVLYDRNPGFTWPGTLLAMDLFNLGGIMREIPGIVDPGVPSRLPGNLLVFNPAQQHEEAHYINRLEYCPACHEPAEPMLDGDLAALAAMTSEHLGAGA